MPMLSIIIPAYNEEASVAAVVAKVETSMLPAGFEREIIIINDGSKDRTGEILSQFSDRHTVINQENTGKGGAVRRGFTLAKGDYVIVQDADLEQNPEEFPSLLAPIINGQADVVFGSRFMGHSYVPRNMTMAAHYRVNRLFSILVRILSGTSSTDVWTGYKMYSRHALDKTLPNLRTTGIEFELEVAVLVSKLKLRVVDVPISYAPRWYDEGKKTNIRQAITSLGMLMTFAFRRVKNI